MDFKFLICYIGLLTPLLILVVAKFFLTPKEGLKTQKVGNHCYTLHHSNGTLENALKINVNY
jgi:hypothetical protein